MKEKLTKLFAEYETAVFDYLSLKQSCTMPTAAYIRARDLIEHRKQAVLTGIAEAFPENKAWEDMSQKERRALHVRLWRHLAETGGGCREQTRIMRVWGNKLFSDCPACEVAREIKKSLDVDCSKCQFCPIVWPGGLDCFSHDGFFQQWKGAVLPDVRKALARAIAEMWPEGEK